MKTDLKQLQAALQKCWSQETAFPGVNWSENNPDRGQCVVTALIIQDYEGGELVRSSVSAPFNEKHYYNQLADDKIIDLTSTQYPADTIMIKSTPNLEGFPSIREKLLADKDTRERYNLLKSRVTSHLHN